MGPWGSQGVPESHERKEAGTRAAPRGSKGVDGGPNGAQSGGPGGHLAIIVEPMGPKRVPK